MAIIIGSNGNQTINGTDNGDIIIAGNGNDTINAGAGNDVVTGGNGNDVINGGAGIDIIDGGAGNDTIDGGSGSDIISGGAGNDTLIYRAAENVGAIDLYDGGSGNDTLRLIVTQAMANSAVFKADLALLQSKLAHGSTSFAFSAFNLLVTSIESVQVVIDGGTTNHAPVAVADTVSGTEDIALTILASTLLANDTDADANDSKTLVSVQGAQHGTVSLNSSGNVVFTADANYFGVASFTYTMKDSAGATSTATVTVNVAAVNDAPVATAVTLAPIAEDSGARIITKAELLAGVTDVDSTSLSITSLTIANGGHGTLTANSNGTWTYTPAANDDTSVTFNYTASDGSLSSSSTAFLDITPVNDAPVATPVTLAAIAEDSGPRIITKAELLAGVTDVDSTNLNITSLTIASGGHGTLTANSNGTWTYTPVANDDTSVTFNYTASDGVLTANSTAFLDITPVNDAPVATPVTLTAIAEDSGPRTITKTELLSHVADVDSTNLSITALSIASGNGTLTDNGNGTWTYTPAANDDTSVTFNYTASDGALTANSTASLDITPVNDAPVAVADTVSATEDVPATILASTLLSNDTDVDAGDTQTLVSVQDAQHGTISLNSNHDVVFTAEANYSGAASFTYTMKDSAGATSTATVTVNVAPVSDAPTITTSSSNGIATDATIPLHIQVALTDSSETLGQSVIINGVPSSYVLNHGSLSSEDGTWTVALSDLANLALVRVPDSKVIYGDSILTITATSQDGSAAVANATAQVTVSIDAPANAFSSRVQDGYVAGATVFADHNHNGVLDTGEISATTAADGTFTLIGADPNDTLVMFGGTDISTGLAFAGTLSAPGGSTVVTPLTTLVVSVAQSTGQSIAAAQTNVKAALGLAAGVDLTNYDAVAATASGTDANAASVLAAAVQVQATITQLTAATGSGASVTSALATAVSTGAPVDLTSQATVTSVATGLGLSGQALDAVSQVVSEANQTVADAATGTDATQILSGLSQAANIALGATTTAIANTNFSNSGSVATLTTNYTGDALTTQVDNAPISIVTAPILGTIGNDTLAGTAGNDAIDGKDGDDTLSGGDGNDQIFGGEGRDKLIGGAGDDLLDGGNGFDRVDYSSESAPVVVHLAAGTATGATIGTDTLRSIEAAIGTSGNDTFDAVGFTATSTNGGGLGIMLSNGLGPMGGLNEFEGLGGDDTITGNGLTRISYQHANAAVTVNLSNGTAHGTAAGDTAGVGNDTLLGVIAQVRGSNFDDTLIGSNNGTSYPEIFEGMGGNDFIDGNGGFDRVRYDNQSTGALGIKIDLGAGTITGLDAAATAVVGLDTLRSIESVRATNSADIFDASGFTYNASNPALSSVNNGGAEFGTFNEFEGMGGNDTIIGNGGTRLSYVNSTGAVTVTTAGFGGSNNPQGGSNGTVVGDSSVGTDTFSGVNTIIGSYFNDTMTGSNNPNNTAETFIGWGGDDLITGGGGFDRLRYDVNSVSISNVPLTAGITVNMAAGTVDGIDDYAKSVFGHDTLRGIEAIRGTSAADLYNAVGMTGIAAGSIASSTTANVSESGANGGGSGFNEFEGLGGDDIVTGNGNTRISYSTATSGVTVTMTGTTALTTGVTGGSTGFSDGADTGHDTFSGVNAVIGSNLNDTIKIAGGTGSSYSINGGNGTDTVTLTSGGSFFLNLSAVENINSTSTASKTLSLGSSQFGVFFDLGAGGPNTLNLAAGGNTVAIQNVAVVTANGAGNDVLNLGSGGNNLTISNIETINGGAGTDTITLGVAGTVNIAGVENIVGSAGNDTVNLGGGGNVTVSGIETVTGLAGSNPIVTLGAAGTVNIANVGTIIGSSGADTVNLGSSNNVTISGVENINAMFGANPNVTLGAAGSVTVQNISVLTGSAGLDEVTLGSAGTITLSQVEKVHGSAGNDTVFFVGSTTFDNVETIHGGTGFETVTLGAASTVTVNNVGTVIGSSGDDHVTIVADPSVTALSETIDLGGGNNTLTLGVFGTPTINLALTNVQTVNSSGGIETVFLQNVANGLDIDLGGGVDTLNLANGNNTVTVHNVETLNAAGTGNNNITLYLDNSVNQTISTGFGTDTLTLAGANSTMNISLIGVENVIGATDSGNETLTLRNVQTAGTSFDLGAGNDTLNLFGQSGLFNNVTVKNIETVNGSFYADNITIANDSGVTTVTGGNGGDSMTASAGDDHFRYTSVGDSFSGGQDLINNFDGAHDQFVFQGMGGTFTSPSINYIGTNVFDALGSAEARIVGDATNATLQIDGNGDGVTDMSIMLHNWANLQNSSFMLLA